MRPTGVTVIVLAWAALAAAALAAQGRSATARAVDRVVAVVGTKPILASQVEEQLVLAQSQGAKVPEDSAGRDAARRQILSQMVDEELLVQQAERDTTIKVTDQEVQDAVEQTVQTGRSSQSVRRPSRSARSSSCRSPTPSPARARWSLRSRWWWRCAAAPTSPRSRRSIRWTAPRASRVASWAGSAAA